MRRVFVCLVVCLVVVAACLVAGLAAGASKPPPFAQTGNDRPVAWMQLHDSTVLADNFVGDQQMTYDPTQDCGVSDRSLCALGNRYQGELGLKWVRISGGGLDWQHVESAPSRYSIPQAIDQLFDGWVAHGIGIVLTLGVGSGTGRPDATHFADPKEIERYTRYARFMVRHFKGRVGYFEIWNEPDANNAAGEIPVGRYINLVEQVVPAIRAEDPNAKIVVGAICNTGIEYGYPGYGSYGRQTLDVAYLKALITSGIAPLVDGISWHPFYGARADDPYYQTYPQVAAELQRLAQAEGFTGRFFAEEMKWITAIDGEDPWQQPVSLAVATKYLLRTVALHRGLDFLTVIGIPQKSVLGHPLPLHAINNILAGATPVTVPAKIATKAKPLRSYGFSLPNGQRMLALWTDGLPRDTDPGTPATLTLPGQAGHTATALDALRAKQQTLIASSRNGSLVIKGLLVRDYPLFIRLGG